MTTLKYLRPWLYGKQERALFHDKRYGLVEASTKSGKTVGCLAWLFEQAAVHGREGRNYWWIAPTLPVAKIAFRRMKRAIPRQLYTANDSECFLTLVNGAVLWFKGADRPDLLYGEDVYAAVMDEATRCKPEAWHAVRSTLSATQGPIRIIGNVKGRRNWAYELARKAEAGAADMHYAKLVAGDAVKAGILSQRDVADAKDKLPLAVFRELYLAQPSEDAGNPFGLDHIDACLALAGLSEADPVVWGWDLAKSQDWTVGCALDAKGRLVAFERWQGPWELSLAKITSLTGHCAAYVDSTGAGDPIWEALAKHNRLVIGYHFTEASKQQLMEGLAVAIQKHDIRYPEGVLAQELRTFEYEVKRTGAQQFHVRYAAPEGLYDDCVCALALAVYGWRRAAQPTVAAGELRPSLFAQESYGRAYWGMSDGEG